MVYPENGKVNAPLPAVTWSPSRRRSTRAEPSPGMRFSGWLRMSVSTATSASLAMGTTNSLLVVLAVSVRRQAAGGRRRCLRVRGRRSRRLPMALGGEVDTKARSRRPDRARCALNYHRRGRETGEQGIDGVAVGRLRWTYRGWRGRFYFTGQPRSSVRPPTQVSSNGNKSTSPLHSSHWIL